MKIRSRIAVPLLVALVMAAGIQPASAICAGARLIQACEEVCKYVYVGTQGQAPGATLSGHFWGYGGGNTTVGLGDDNGSDAAQGNSDLGIDWVKQFQGLYYLAGAWSNAGVDGCVDNATTPSPKRTVVTYYDVAPSQRPGSSKLAGYFMVLCQVADTGLNYGYFGTPGQHVLAPVPYPSVTTSGPGSVQVAAPTPAALAAGTAALAPSCTGLVRGYRLCSIVGTSEPTNLNRASGGWTCGAEIPIGQPATQAVPPCGSTQLLYLATSLVFEGGFETAYVSEDTKISCGLTADRPSNNKLIKKPRTTAPQR